ncbi:MAG: NUDIX hydrolase [Microbacteriaceae bacterium]|nr:NUDIX hydrolase [Microbacteriaceae bacterium]
MSSAVLAAGALCWRVTAKGRLKVLLVFRTQHRDVSLPKGKVDKGETLPETAVREIAEETGLVVRLGPPLGVIEYTLSDGRDKQVYYWSAEVSPEARANSTFVSNDEIESLHWVTVRKARKRMSYRHDRDLLDRFVELHEQGRARTFALVALRHGKAVAPQDWDGPDATRPLLARGEKQAISVAPGVAAFGPARLLSSTAARCLATIAPTARLTGLDVTESPEISQDAYTGRGDSVARVVGEVLDAGASTVLCSHGPVLPQILRSAADATGGAGAAGLSRAAALSTGEFAVLHIPAERPETGIVAVEVHSPTV